MITFCTILPVPEAQTLLDWLAAAYPQAKRTTLRRMLEAGRVTVNGRPAVNARTPLKASDVVKVADQSSESTKASLDPLVLVFEDADLLVVDKPAGLLTST